MSVFGRLVVFQWPSRNRTPWVLLALTLILASAYSAMRWLGAVGAISGWIGLPQYADRIPELVQEAQWWERLALGLPFIAAFVLGLGTRRLPDKGAPSAFTYATDAQTWSQPILRYFGRLVISVLGTLAIILCWLLIGLVLIKLRIHSA